MMFEASSSSCCLLFVIDKGLLPCLPSCFAPPTHCCFCFSSQARAPSVCFYVLTHLLCCWHLFGRVGGKGESGAGRNHFRTWDSFNHRKKKTKGGAHKGTGGEGERAVKRYCLSGLGKRLPLASLAPAFKRRPEEEKENHPPLCHLNFKSPFSFFPPLNLPRYSRNRGKRSRNYTNSATEATRSYFLKLAPAEFSHKLSL